MSFGTLFVKCCCQVKIRLNHYFGIFSIFCAQMITFFLFTKGVIACTSAWVTVVLGEFRVALGSSIGLDFFISILGSSIGLNFFTSLLGSSIDLIFYIDTWLKY